MASIAGTASSVQGVIGTIGRAGIGKAACGIAALLLTLVTEKGRLMRDPQQPAPLTEDMIQFPD